MLNFPDVTYLEEKEARKEYNRIEKTKREIFHYRMMWESDKIFRIPAVRKLPLDRFPISQKYSTYSKLPYGKIGTVGKAGCGVFAVEYALRLMGLYIDFKDILDECVSKGYRAYAYDENDQIIDGAGTKNVLFDNLAVECRNLSELIFQIKSGVPVTLLIQNSMYNNNPEAKGCHFITIVGIDENGNTLLMDGNRISDVTVPLYAFCVIPFMELLKGLEGAWGWNKGKVLGYLK